LPRVFVKGAVVPKLFGQFIGVNYLFSIAALLVITPDTAICRLYISFVKEDAVNSVTLSTSQSTELYTQNLFFILTTICMSDILYGTENYR